MIPEKIRKSSTPIGIAGAGRIGQALGRLLRERGQPVVAIASRSAARASEGASFIGGVDAVSYAELAGRAERIIIAVPDAAIAGIASVLAESGLRRGIVLHTCGALSPVTMDGVSSGVLHPLQTVAAPSQGLAGLLGIAFAIEGDAAAIEWAEEIVALLDGEPLRIPPGKKALYHAAAVMASNYIVGLVDAAVMLMGEAGVAEDRALRALAPLVRASAENALSLGPVKALTGPVERGDFETVANHLKALAEAPESIRDMYHYAAVHVSTLAERKRKQ
jgi:predicted short-subunit dehydrogenase-like oxidoreductase (DUF2520 family)